MDDIQKNTWHYRLINALTAWGLVISGMYAFVVSWDINYFGGYDSIFWWDFLVPALILSGLVFLVRFTLKYILYGRIW